MSSFTDPLIVTPNDDETSWTLVSPFRYWITELHKGDVLTLPVGFKTDFASIPRIFWNILSPYGRYGKIAVVHDYLYRNGGFVNVAEFDQPVVMKKFERAECDQIFLDGMEYLGVNWITRKLMYRMVRIFGGSSYVRSN
jgi:hypothetical protein